MTRPESARHVYGPVPSRRLGRSLGVDPLPAKTCNWNCVYCQLGRTTPVTNRRAELSPTDAVVEELRQALEERPAVDWITFVGAGEPTLHAGLGRMIRAARSLADAPVAVITNGALLGDPEVRREVAAADAVLPSLDAASEPSFRAVNRPHPALTLERHVAGLTAFRREFRGSLWLEVMLVGGLNDGPQDVARLAELIGRIEPDEVHLNVPTRPPAEAWVRAPTAATLERARATLGEVARLVSSEQGAFDMAGCDDRVEAVAAIIARHPMSEEDVLAALAPWPAARVAEELRRLEASGRAQSVERGGKRFWTAGSGCYGARRAEGSRRGS